MNLIKISLQNFRNYPQKTFQLDKITVVVGPNGSGKSNLVEAIYLLATGKSFRADRENEMVMYEKNFARVRGEQDDLELEVVLNERKRYLVNGVGKRMVDFVGQIRVVLFAPQDLDLVTGSPSQRRKYLDFVISQKDREYRRCLLSYEKGLRQRNKLLDLIREGLAERSQLFFWDKLLIKNGEYLTAKREEYLTGLRQDKYQADYDKSIISPARLAQYEMEEVAAATTLVGPHRDDFVINLGGRDVSKFGSRGEQRLAVLWLKKGEIAYLEGNPILVLDDIFSELDQGHKQDVVDWVSNYSGQVIMATTDLNQIELGRGSWTPVHLED